MLDVIKNNKKSIIGMVTGLGLIGGVGTSGYNLIDNTITSLFDMGNSHTAQLEEEIKELKSDLAKLIIRVCK